jgi:hypothetical protein
MSNVAPRFPHTDTAGASRASGLLFVVFVPVVAEGVGDVLAGGVGLPVDAVA